MNSQILSQVSSMPATQLSEASSDLLQKALIAAMTEVTHAKRQLEHIEQALDMRYAQRAKALRLAQGKDTGVVHFDDGRVRITADLPKKVDWDQTRLAEITRRIAANGDDPSEYVEVSYRISETKFNAWPEAFKACAKPSSRRARSRPASRAFVSRWFRSNHHANETYANRSAAQTA